MRKASRHSPAKMKLKPQTTPSFSLPITTQPKSMWQHLEPNIKAVSRCSGTASAFILEDRAFERKHVRYCRHTALCAILRHVLLASKTSPFGHQASSDPTQTLQWPRRSVIRLPMEKANVHSESERTHTMLLTATGLLLTKKIRMMGLEMVDLYVGPKREHYRLHKERLCEKIP